MSRGLGDVYKRQVTTLPFNFCANFRSLISTSAISGKSPSHMITSIGSSFWILFNISNPLLPLVLFKESEQSEMCLNSSRTKVGITKAPSIKPVWHKSKILPSIITDVSKTFGVASFFLLEELFVFFSSFSSHCTPSMQV